MMSTLGYALNKLTFIGDSIGGSGGSGLRSSDSPELSGSSFGGLEFETRACPKNSYYFVSETAVQLCFLTQKVIFLYRLVKVFFSN